MIEIKDISDLIHIRNYVYGAINNSALHKTVAHELNKIQILLDNTIVEHILSVEFKDLIGFEGVDAAVKEARANNNIKQGMSNLKQEGVPVVASAGSKTHLIKPERV